MAEIYEVVTEISSGVMIYVPSSTTIGILIQKLIWTIRTFLNTHTNVQTHTHTEEGDFRSIFFFSK
jgi:hypothetical protein